MGSAVKQAHCTFGPTARWRTTWDDDALARSGQGVQPREAPPRHNPYNPNLYGESYPNCEKITQISRRRSVAFPKNEANT
jgi:hypothetical protein